MESRSGVSGLVLQTQSLRQGFLCKWLIGGEPSGGSVGLASVQGGRLKQFSGVGCVAVNNFHGSWGRDAPTRKEIWIGYQEEGGEAIRQTLEKQAPLERNQACCVLFFPP